MMRLRRSRPHDEIEVCVDVTCQRCHMIRHRNETVETQRAGSTLPYLADTEQSWKNATMLYERLHPV